MIRDNNINTACSILIVDDDESSRQIISGVLEREFSLYMAATGAECYRQLEAHTPDLVLLDIILPDASGIDICRQIKLNDSLRDIPVILVTIKTEDEDVQTGLEAGAEDYLKKPIRVLELMARVKSTLRMSNLVKQLRQSDEEKQQLINELESALREVKQLSGLLPICSQCKNIRDDNGYWQRIESYLSTHSSAQFSHSLCPGCMSELYGNESWFPQKSK